MLDTYGNKIGYSIMQLMDAQEKLTLIKNGHLRIWPEHWETLQKKTIEILETTQKNLSDLPFELSKSKIKSMIDSLRNGRTMRDAENTLHEIVALRERILDESAALKFYHVPRGHLDYYDNQDGFSELITKLPGIAYDCAEAGKCIALERYTASVFHLMQVMEIGVVELGNKLGVRNASEKTWGAISAEMEHALKGKYSKNLTPSEKVEQASYAVLISHLNAVRIAWRNPTMHPKSLYGCEEARDIFQHVRLFARSLAGIL